MLFARPIFSIAINTFREAIRNKVLGSLLFFVVIASIGTALLGELSLHEEERVTADGVLFLSTIFCVVIAIHSTVTLLHNEIERRTIYTLLSKPIARWQFLLGKFFGVAVLLAVIVTLLFFVSLGLFSLQGGELSVAFVAAYFTLFLQLLLVTAITLLFASFSTPLLSGMFTVALFVAGNLMTQLQDARTQLAETSRSLGTLVDVLSIALPNFEALNLSTLVTYAEPIPAGYLAAGSWYTASYCAVILGLAMLIFSRRDFG